jgi:hypothetical protein
MANRYAHPSGSGSSPCTNAGSPCSLTTAINATGPGDTLILQAGTYSNGFNFPGGKSSNSQPTIITVDVTGSVTITGTFYIGDNTGLTFNGQGRLSLNQQYSGGYDTTAFGGDNATFENFEITRTRTHGAFIAGDNLTLRNVTVSYIGTDASGNAIAGVENTCGTNGPASCHGIYIGNNGQPMTIENCHFHHIHGWCMTLEAGIFTLRNNIWHDCSSYGDGGGVQLVYHLEQGIGSDGSVVYNNVGYDTPDGSALFPLHGIAVYHNTFYNVPTGIYPRDGSNTLRNNLIYNCPNPIDPTSGNTLSDNLVDVNPLFADEGAGDFRLTAGSPAIGHCPRLGSVTTDILGAGRNNPTAAGAYEYTGAVIATDSKVAEWTMDESSGNAVDQTGNGHTAVIVGCTRVAGQTGNALHFDGNDYAVVTGTVKPPDDFTLVAIMRALPGAEGVLLNLYDAISLNVLADGNLYGYFHSSSAYNELVTTTVNVNTNLWHTIVLRKTSTDLTLYVDTTAARAFGSFTGNTAYLTSEFTLGKRANFNEAFYTGDLDYAAVYDYALSPAELSAILGSSLPTATTDLVRPRLTETAAKQDVVTTTTHTLMRQDRSYVNPRQYGSALTHTTLQAALAAIGSTQAGLLLTPGTWAIGANLTIPANVTLVRARGAILSVSTGVTVTLNGDQEGPMSQWLTLAGTGTIVFGLRIPDLYAEWFGASADGTTNCTVALNTAASLAANQKKILRLLAGTYKITNTWWLTPPGSVLLTAHVVGAGRGYIAGISQTAIDATDPAMQTKPALVIQFARSAYLGHLLVTGPNVAPAALAPGNMRYNATWVTAGVRDSRYSPQCGLAIDVGLGTTPPDGGYPGITYTGAGGGSSDIVLDNLGIRDCVVGLMCTPDAAPANQGDTIMLREPNILGTKVGIAVGQSQVRGVNVLGGAIGVARDAINCHEYGQQIGGSVQVYGTQFGPGFQAIAANPAVAPTVMVGIRSESLHRLGGGSGGSGGDTNITFIGCDIHVGSDEVTPAPLLWETTTAGLLFLGGFIGFDPPVSHPAILPFAYPASFQGTKFRLKNRFRPYIGSPQDFNVPITLENCSIVDATGGGQLYGATGRLYQPGARVSAHWSLSELKTSQGDYRYVPGGYPYRSAVTASAYVFTATTLTFTLTDPSYLLVGDVLLWRFKAIGASAIQQRGVALEVTNKVGTTITCALLYDRSYYDETSPPNYVDILVHEWAPGQALTGNLTSGSPTITSVSPTTILQNGDWLKGASGIPADARVVSGGGTATLTLNKNAAATATGVALFWGRLHTLNTTVAF